MAEKEYIEREAVVDNLEWDNDIRKWTISEDELNNLPAADVVEVVHAEWIPHEHVSRSPYARNYDCSACGSSPIELGAFCNNCGAKMDGGKTE